MMKVPMSEIASRIVNLQALLAKHDTDVAILSQNADLFYFTGTVQDGHLVVPAQGNPVFLVRRDPQRAESQSFLRPIRPMKSIRELAAAVTEAVEGSRLQRVGLELDVLSANTFFFLDEKLFPRQQLVDVSGLVRQVRMVKSPWEIQMMRGAAAISRAVSDAVPELMHEGVTELELTIELERVARKAGHLGLIRLRNPNMDMYFGHILSGPDAAVPAYGDMPTGGCGVSPAFGQGPSERRIMRNEMVSVDTMLSFHGYLSDQTRNFCLGTPPSRLREAYALSRQILERLCAEGVPGSVTGELYGEICRWVDEAGWTNNFMGVDDQRVSFVGHGLGIEVDELPIIAAGQRMVLQEGMTFAVEPKFVLPGMGLAGIENTYVVTPEGLESLNTAPEELICL